MSTTSVNCSEFGDWYDVKYPFRHFRASNVLNQKAYSTISSAFSSILYPKLTDVNNNYKFSKANQRYDALMVAMNPELAALFIPFFSEAFLKMISDFLAIPFLPRIDGGLHSSPKHSRSGWIHTDFCSAWFDESQVTDNAILFPNRSRCDYFTGVAKTSSAKPVEYVRAATLIYYLCNDSWKPGDGGETGVYGSARLTPRTEYDLIKPLNNTLLLFECSPHSYHCFINNPGLVRNSLIMWLHTSVDYAESNWGKSINRSQKQ